MEKYSDKIVSFAGDNIDVYKLFEDYFDTYRAETGKTGVSFDTTKSLKDKETILNAQILCEIERVSNMKNTQNLPTAVFAMNPNVVWATYAVISAMTDLVLPKVIIDSIGMYTEVRVGDFGDNFSFKVSPRDLFVVSKHGRGRRRTELHKQFKGEVIVTPELREVTVGVALARVLAGQESLAEFVMKLVQSIESQMAYDCYAAFNTAMGNLPNTPANQALRVVGAWDAQTAVQLAQRVSAFNGGVKPIFVGTQLALSNILPNDANYRYELDSAYVKVGYIPVFQGYNCLVLPQIADWENPFAVKLDDTRIYIMATSVGKPVKLCLEGSTLTNATGTFDAANLEQTTTLFKSWGVGIATSAVAACYDMP